MQVKIIPERRYWFVRTEAGKYYDEFVAKGFVAIGWNEISDLSEIRDSKESNDIVDRIKERIKNVEHPDGKEELQPGRIYNQINRFVNEMNVGDIVLIPSKNSLLIEFGIVRSDVFLDEPDEEELEDEMCPFIKKRSVEWLTRRNKYKLDPYLFQLLNSHHAISSADEYAHYIDRTLNSFFIKGDKAHLIYRVEKQEEISAYTLMQLINYNLDIIDLFNQKTDSDLRKEDIQIKINVQSPGPFELIGSIKLIFIISLGITALLGGKASFVGLNVQFDKGLIKQIIEFVDWIKENKDKSELKAKIDALQLNIEALEAKIPSELTEGIKEDE